MRVLYIGDVMGEVGIETVEAVLPELAAAAKFDLVIAQGENVTNGRGISLLDYKRLQHAGVQFFTGGNHILRNDSILPELKDPEQPIIRPANYPLDTPGLGYKYIATPIGRVLIMSVLGQIVGRQSSEKVDNPLKVIDRILASQTDEERVATIVNFHGDFSSEKVIIGHYLDGRVSAVIGDHWHVPTADAQVLPKGTAHISDVGMTGSLDSSLGVSFDSVVRRWRDDEQTRNVLETAGRRQFNAVEVDIDESTGLATSIEAVRRVLPA